ncbi:hypothetical protein CR513_29216, partial [Mucuna pruriens]
MEHAVENLEQENLDLRGEMGQMKKQINKIFELFTQGATLNAATSARGSTIYPLGFTPPYNNVHPYGMPPRRNANTGEQPALEGNEQAGMNNSGIGPTQGSGTGPTLIPEIGSHIQPAGIHHLVDLNGIRDQPREPKKSLSKRGKIIEGTDNHGLDAANLCLVPDIALPADFKVPKFEKYKGSSCPRVHLAMYCRKMASYIHQDKILVHCFQDSLTRATLSWYVGLERSRRSLPPTI